MGRTSTPKPRPHPLSPSPHGGEGERKVSSSSPLSTKWRGGKGVRTNRAQKARFTRKLLAWWARAARDLPWRRTRDPYRVLVSEFMLQQTQVSRVAEYYPRFLERFPDLDSLARARSRAWSVGITTASCPTYRKSWSSSRVLVHTQPEPWRRSHTRNLFRRWTPTSIAYSGACSSIVQRATCNVQRRSGIWHRRWYRKTASGPGSSIRPSWSWAP